VPWCVGSIGQTCADLEETRHQKSKLKLKKLSRRLLGCGQKQSTNRKTPERRKKICPALRLKKLLVIS
jgi:hypothetical protein